MAQVKKKNIFKMYLLFSLLSSFMRSLGTIMRLARKWISGSYSILAALFFTYVTTINVLNFFLKALSNLEIVKTTVSYQKYFSLQLSMLRKNLENALYFYFYLHTTIL